MNTVQLKIRYTFVIQHKNKFLTLLRVVQQHIYGVVERIT